MARISRIELVTRWWRSSVIGTVDHVAVNDAVHDDAGWNARYLFMTTMSAGIAILGLLLSSPAVVIGAMLISPLMGPIIGLGFAVATVDARQIRRALFALAAGALFAVVFSAALVLASPLQNVTSELAARTRPNLFDLLVALFSALAGSYATIRGRAGTIVGVAIATALMPPLATVGFGLATWNAPVFWGALLLFVTNFVTIALSAAVMARLYGFGGSLSPNQTALQLVLVIGTFAALAVPLGVSLRQIAWEGRAGVAARGAIRDTFEDGARISQVDLDFAARPLRVTATVLTPDYRADADAAASRALSQALGTQALVHVEQVRVGTGESEAAAALRAAQDRRSAGADAQADALADRLALLAGVDRAAVTIDRQARRARVIAAALPGAPLASYRALEARAAVEGWDVALVPPAVAPEPAALDDAAWAAQRLGLAVRVDGTAAAADDAIAPLEAAGARVVRGATTGPLALAWSVPALTPEAAAAPVSLAPSPAPR